MKKNLFSFMIVAVLFCCLPLLQNEFVYAAEKALTVGYEPVTANFSIGQKNVVYVVLRTDKDSISAAAVTITATGGVKLVDMLSPVNEDNTPLTNTKLIDKNVSEKTASATILIVKSTIDLPSTIRIPVIVTGNSGSGNVKIDAVASKVVDATGSSYTLSKQKEAYITFSQSGKNSDPLPSPTPIPKNSMILHMVAKLQGVNPSSLATKSIPGVKVQLVQQKGATTQVSLPYYTEFFMDNAGNAVGSVVVNNMQPGGKYRLLIKGPKHLQKRICEDNPSEENIGEYKCNAFSMKLNAGENTINLAGITLMAGDFGLQDGILNSYDLSYVQNAIWKTSKISWKDADINYDGKVDKKDYDLVTYSLGHTSGLDQK